ncbi:MAG: hypothetical protein LBG52_02125 [Candidatus Peribacteria bacterium]|jgi:uncharacterized metal-binding protein|nr:hypothetical protein [Candidatus Peribacteria bacterium]
MMKVIEGVETGKINIPEVNLEKLQTVKSELVKLRMRKNIANLTNETSPLFRMFEGYTLSETMEKVKEQIETRIQREIDQKKKELKEIDTTSEE